jgi:hypothetical protein
MRRALVAAACALVVAGCGSKAVETGQAPVAPEAGSAEVTTTVPPTINKQYVEQAQKDGATTVTLMVSVKDGQHDQVRKALEELGASVEAQDPRIGYLRAEVPIAKVNDVPALPGDSTVDLDLPLSNRDPEP